MSRFSKHLAVGIGGVGCSCCFPAPGSKARKLKFRRAKRLDEALALKEATHQLADKEHVE